MLDSLLREVEERPPDVVVTDIRMPPTNTDEGIRAGGDLRSRTRTSASSSSASTRTPRTCSRCSSRAPTAAPTCSRSASTTAASSWRRSRPSPQRQSVIDPKIVEVLVAAKTRSERSPLAELTPRELEVLAAIAEGKSNAAISESLVLTKRAVEKHINSIFLKLNLSHSQDADEVSPRVKAALLFLAESDGDRAPRGRRAPLRSGGERHCRRSTRPRVAAADDRLARSAERTLTTRSLGSRGQASIASGARPHGRRPGDVPRRRARRDRRHARASRPSARRRAARRRSSPSTGSHPQLVLLDVRMPGIDGIEVARRLAASIPTRWSC